MKRIINLLTFLLLIQCYTFAQSCYNTNRQNGITAFNQGNYTAAKASFLQAGKCPDRPSDNDIQSWISKCDNKINQAKGTYIHVDGKSSTTSNYSVEGGSENFSVSTDAVSWTTYGVPSWCSIENKTSTGFRLRVNKNTSNSSRNDWMEVRTANGHSARINIKQDGAGPSAKLNSVDVDFDVQLSDGKGMRIKIDLNILNMKNKKARVIAYFYDKDGKHLKDTDGSYGTTGEYAHQVAVGKSVTPTSENARYQDNLKLEIPYSQLHQTGTGKRDLKYSISVWDYSVSPHKEIFDSNFYLFYYTPSSLSVNGSSSDRRINFNESGGRETFSVNAAGSSYETWGVPDWCSIENKTSSGFTLVCKRNTKRSSRSDYMKVTANGKEIRIDITQNAATGPTVNITSVKQEHNVFRGLVKGINIVVIYEVNGMQNKTVTATAWFYQSDNKTKLIAADWSQVHSSSSGTAPYESTTFTSNLFMPYTGLNMAKGFSGTLTFDIAITDSSGNQLARLNNQAFTFSQF